MTGATLSAPADLWTPTAPGDHRADPELHELATFLRDCARRGVLITPDGDTLRVRAPVGGISPSLRDQIVERKPALLAYLQTYPCTGCGRSFGFRSPTRCFWCRVENSGENSAGGGL